MEVDTSSLKLKISFFPINDDTGFTDDGAEGSPFDFGSLSGIGVDFADINFFIVIRSLRLFVSGAPRKQQYPFGTQIVSIDRDAEGTDFIVRDLGFFGESAAKDEFITQIVQQHDIVLPRRDINGVILGGISVQIIDGFFDGGIIGLMNFIDEGDEG